MSAGLSSPGKYLRVTVPTDVTQGLESLALACGATLFTVAMAAWQVPSLLQPLSVQPSLSILCIGPSCSARCANKRLLQPHCMPSWQWDVQGQGSVASNPCQ